MVYLGLSRTHRSKQFRTYSRICFTRNENVSKFLMVTALAAIGLNTSFKDMKKSGIAPMIHGFIISALVVIVAIAVEWFMGIV